MNSLTRISTVCLAVITLMLASCAPKVDRTIVPEPKAAPEVQLGSYDTFTLDNGLKVIVVQNNKLPRVSFNLFVDHGPIKEGAKAGAADMAGELLKAGTDTKSKAEIDETIDFMGASLSTSASGSFASGLSKHKTDIFALMADVVLNPTFPEEELEKARKRILSGLTSSKTDPNTISSNIKARLNYDDHPFGELTTEETVEAVQREDLAAFYNTWFKPNISYMTIVGDITLDEAKSLTNAHFGGWAKGDVDKPKWGVPLPPQNTEVAVVPLDGAVQSVIDVTYPVELKTGDADAIAVSVMNNILGGGTFSGRLFQNLREDKAFTYGAYSSLSPGAYAATFSAGASVRNEVTDSAIVEIMYEVRRMIKEPVPDSTLQFIKNWMNGTFALGLESPQTIARFALNIERFGLPKDYYQTYLARLNAITSADIQRVAQKYLKPENAYITVVGAKSDLEGKLDGFGEVTYYDMYGDLWVDRQAAPEGVTATTVLEAYINAMGGAEALSAISSYEAQGTMGMAGMQLTMTNKMKDQKKLYTKMEMQGMVMLEQVFDGEKGSVSQMGQSQPMDEATIADNLQEADMLFEMHLADYGIEAELLGMEEAVGEMTYVVEYTYPDGHTSTDHFSVATGMRVQHTETETGPDGSPVVAVSTYPEFMEVDGVKFPKKQLTNVGPQTLTITFDKVEVNKKISDKDFEVK